MRKTGLPLFISFVFFCLTAGCAQTPPFVKGGAINQICVPDAETEHAMQAAEDVLAQMHFTIEKADAEQGFIKTRPLRAAQAFELWRSDNIGSFNTEEANIHTLRRIAQMNLTRIDQQLCIDCEVKTQRLSLPQRRTSTAHAYGLFSKSESSTQRLQLDAEQTKAMAWVDLGQDKMLSTAILKRLEKRLSAPADKAEMKEKGSL
jgi:protease II